MDRKRAPDASIDAPTEVEQLPSSPFTLTASPTIEHPWLGHTAFPGELLDGRYELGERIRVAPMGDLFAATQLSVQRRVAVQLLRPELARDAGVRQRLERGALALAAVDHHNIVRVLDLCLGDPPFVVLELPAGPSIAEVIAQHGPLEPTRAVRIALQLAAALRTAHARGVVHGDVRADKVILSPRQDEGEVPKLIDFDLAQAAPSVTFAAPDVADGVRADLRALASLLRLMLVGHDPRGFDRERLRARLARYRAPVSADRLYRVIERGLAGSAWPRFDSAAQLEEALCASVSPSVHRRLPRQARIVRQFLLISLAAIVISGLIAFLWARRQTASDAAETWHDRGSP
jgi:serine/threonine protein kinase